MLREERLDLVGVAPRWVDGHHDMVIACAEAGVKGIFCEKPFAATLAEADAMLKACERQGVRVAVAYRQANATNNTPKNRLLKVSSVRCSLCAGGEKEIIAPAGWT